MSQIARFYNGKSVLVFGVTGFIGRSVVEKLLRSCPGLRNVYCLIQAQGGQSARDRLETMRKREPIFNVLDKKHPDRWNKVRVIDSRYDADDLGVSTEDKKLLADEVDIVFNSSGVSNFTANLRRAADQHVYSAVRLMNLIEHFHKVKHFGHMSSLVTSFDQEKTGVKEITYPKKIDEKQLTALLKNHDDSYIEKIAPQYTFIRNHIPGPIVYYGLLKGIAENYLVEKCKERNLSLAMIRSAWVQNAAREPAPGMIDRDAKFLLSQIVLGIAQGTIKKIVVNPNAELEVAPVDALANTILTAGWDSVCNDQIHGGQPAIYNVSSTHLHPCNRTILEETIRELSMSTDEGSSDRVFVDPAEFKKEGGDELKLNKLERYATYYAKGTTYPDSTRWAELMDRLSEVDKEEFWMDIRQLDWKEYIRDVYKGLIKYHLQSQL